MRASCALSQRLHDSAASRAGNREASLIHSLPHARCRSRRRRRPLPRPAAAFDSDPLAALDKAAALLNRAIGSAEGKHHHKKKHHGKGGDDKSKPAKARWVSFSATATSAVSVAPLLEEAAARDRRERERRAEGASGEGEGGGGGFGKGGGGGGGEDRRRIPGRDLLAYLALPASEYSLLDPAWVTREGEGEGGEVGAEGEADDDDGDGGENGDARSTSSSPSSSSSSSSPESFIVRFPFEELVGIPLTPSFRVRVKSRSPEKGLVAFAADRAALGDPALDAAFEAGVDATLSKKRAKRATTKATTRHARKRGEGGGAGEEEQGEEALAAAAPFFPDEEDAASSLSAHVTVSARVQLSGAAAALPGPLVSLAAKLVSRAVLAATLRPFLTLLVNDYWAWSVGLDRGALASFGDDDRRLLRLQVAQATTEMVERREEEERRRRGGRSEEEKEEAARGEGEVIDL